MCLDGNFENAFTRLTAFAPFPWQRALFDRWCAGRPPAAIDVPTGLGKTLIMAVWLVARAFGAQVPRRLIYVVDRRAVVDQATREAERLAAALADATGADLAEALGLHEGRLPVAVLRGGLGGALARSRLEDPSSPAIVVGTVDMVGSRLLFEGYGASPRMRPFHAALIGCDSLIVLDEAHLVPPFERLLRDLPPRAVASYQLLTLSATGRDTGDVLSLTGADHMNEPARRRLNAAKSLRVLPVAPKLTEALAGAAWTLSKDGTSGRAIVVFCDSRGDAEQVHADLGKRMKGAEGPVRVGLFTGARRGFERKAAVEMLEALGFVPGKASHHEGATFLVATSAAEVGVDLDADDMVGDAVPFERQVQRLGRVNRRGDGAAQVLIVPSPAVEPKDAKAPTAQEHLSRVAENATALLATLPVLDAGGHDASPQALRRLREEHGDAVTDASTPAPLRPAVDRALVDAWSMTSLREHTGRPEIDPWLRGWTDDEPQTRVVWRARLPVCETESGDTGDYATDRAEAFFADAPPQAVEELETETGTVKAWLLKRAAVFARDVRADAKRPDPAHRPVAFALERSGKLRAQWNAGEIDGFDAKAKDRLGKDLAGVTLVVDAALGGLSSVGYLDAAEGAPPMTGDGADSVGFDLPFSVALRTVHDADAPVTRRRPPRDAFVTKRDQEGRAEEWLVIERTEFGDAPADELSRARRANQTLAEHTGWVVEEAERLAARLGLTPAETALLVLAARLHDSGKADGKWQRAMGAPEDGGPFAKIGTRPIGSLDGYRHEFGSVLDASVHPEVAALSADDRDFVLHLIAAHHGHARPLLSAAGCGRGPEQAFAGEVADIALRFARLQRRFGPWRLAWWEMLLRAADQRASERLDRVGV